MATAILNVEPGEYVPCRARFCIGFSSLLLSEFQSARSMPPANWFGLYAGQAGERQDFARARVEDDGGAVVAEVVEPFLGRALHVGVDRQLHAPAFDRLLLLRLAHLAAAAVDDDELVAVRAHEQLVVGAFDARLPHHRTGFGAGVLRPGEVGFARLADVTKEMRGELFLRILPRRHFLPDDAGQLQAARHPCRDLRLGRVLDQNDRPIARFAPAAIDRFAQLRFVGAGGRGEDAQGFVDVSRLLAIERDVEGVLVLDEDLAVAVEQHAARRRQRQAPAVVVLRHLVELLVLRDLEHPERDGEQSQTARPRRSAATVSLRLRFRLSSAGSGLLFELIALSCKSGSQPGGRAR